MGPEVDAAREKMGYAVARQLQSEIESLGWPIGQLLASESDLITKHRVSRAVLREAIGLLEHRGIVEVRRGQFGGIYVSEPPELIVANVITSYLQAIDVSDDELFEARQVVEVMAAIRAVDAIDEAGATRLRQLVELDVDLEAAGFDAFSIALAEAAANPALSMTVRAISLVQSGRHQSLAPSCEPSVRALRDVQRRVASAVIEGDVGDAISATIAHLELLRRVHDSCASAARPFDAARWREHPTTRGYPDRLSSCLARFILAEIRAMGWPVGQVVGSEPFLLARYGVSRAVLREAIRILEFDGIVEMRKGPRGGLVVRRPKRRYLVEEVQRYLRYLRIDALHLLEMESEVELGAMRLMLERLDDDDRERMRRIVDDERHTANEAWHGVDLHWLLADASGNRVLALFVSAFGPAVRQRMPTAAQKQADLFASIARDAHQRIVDAILTGDKELALLRMRRHNEEILPFLRAAHLNISGDSESQRLSTRPSDTSG